MEKALKIEEYREIREKKERASQDLEGSPKNALKEKIGEVKILPFEDKEGARI